MMIYGLNDINVNFTGGWTVGGFRSDISFRESVALWADNNQGTDSQSDTTLVKCLNGNVWISLTMIMILTSGRNTGSIRVVKIMK